MMLFHIWFYREQFVTKENIEAYVTNICAFMMHKKLFGGNETNSNSFPYFTHQLVNFCRQCYLNPNKRITSKFNVTVSTASALASKIEKQNVYWEIGHCKLTSTQLQTYQKLKKIVDVQLLADNNWVRVPANCVKIRPVEHFKLMEVLYKPAGNEMGGLAGIGSKIDKKIFRDMCVVKQMKGLRIAITKSSVFEANELNRKANDVFKMAQQEIESIEAQKANDLKALAEQEKIELQQFKAELKAKYEKKRDTIETESMRRIRNVETKALEEHNDKKKVVEEYIAQCSPDVSLQIRKQSALCTTSKPETSSSSSLTTHRKRKYSTTSKPGKTPKKRGYSTAQIDRARKALFNARRCNLSTKDVEICKIIFLTLEQYELDTRNTLKQAIEIVKKCNPSFRIGTSLLKTKIERLMMNGKYERTPIKKRQVPAGATYLRSLLHDPDIKRSVDIYVKSLERAYRKAQLRNARQKKQNGNYKLETPQLIRASKLRTYVNETLLPNFWTEANIRQKAENFAEEINVTDAGEIDDIYRKIMENKKGNTKICSRTAQNWLRAMGYNF